MRGSLWEDSATEHAHFSSLRQTVYCETCVIGGGISGLSAALHLAEDGVDCIVLEAKQPGWGASGRSGGQIIAGLKYDPDELERKYGERTAEGMISVSANAPSLVYDIIDKYHIECQPRRTGWVQAALSEVGAERLYRRAKVWRQFGAPVYSLDKKSLSKLLGNNNYSGGLIDKRGGSVHPLSYVRGMARAANQLGAQIYGNTRAIKLTRENSKWHVLVDGGAVIAKTVIVASNAHTDDLIQGLAKSIVPVVSMQCATEVLPEHIASKIIPFGHPFSENRRLVRYFRKDEQGRLLIGGRGAQSEKVSKQVIDRMHSNMCSIFPELTGIRFEYAWAGLVAMTADQLPHIHYPEKNLFAALGYNGRGMALATAMGKLLALLSTSRERDDFLFPITRISPLPMHSLHHFGIYAMASWLRLLDYTETRIQ